MKWKAELARLRAELAARDAAAVDAIAQAYEDGRISACNAGKPGCPRVAALEAECSRLREALHDVSEEWAGAECGEPVTAQEAYAIELARRMYRLAVNTGKPKEPKP